MNFKALTLITFIFSTAFIAKGQLQGSETSENQSIYKGTFVVSGDKDTYYPVVFRYGNQDRINHLRIYRGYSEAGPNELSPSHKGGLTLEIDLNYGGWGGSTYDWRIADLRQTYHETFANAEHSMHCKGFTVWLRGGGFVYHYESENPANLQVAYANDIIFTTPYPEHPEYTVKASDPTKVVSRDNINAHLLTPSFIKQGNDIFYTQGFVGIGTSDPKNRLDVKGTIRAKEVKVVGDGEWPDFVFDDSYNLPELSTVESFIKENRHLPEIPSATDVKQNGVNVGDMQAKLLQKVEELTLYMITLSKENKEINKEINKIKSKK